MPFSTERRWLAGSATLIAIALVFNLNGYPLIDPDEGRNAEVMREMASSHDYVLPQLNGLPYLDKPIVYFAAGAAAMELLGPTELAARLPSLVFTLGTLALVGWLAAILFGRDSVATAVIATAATPFTLAYSRIVIFDSALTFWVVLALVGFYRAVEAARPRPPRHSAFWWRALAWGAMALGVLTKGPIALALPLMVMVPYALWRRAARALWDPTALLVFVALITPWVFAVSQEVPDFLAYVVATETFGRLTNTELGRTGPFWYFLVLLPAAALPWSVIYLSGARRLPLGSDHRMVFLLAWILIPLVFFTLSQSKRPQYVLPLVPAIGLLVAGLWHRAPRPSPGIRTAGVVLVGLGLFLIAGAGSFPHLVAATPAIAAAIPRTALLLGMACVAAGAAVWWWRARREIVLFALSLPLAVIPLVSRDLMSAIGSYRSAREMAREIEAVATPATQIIAVEVFPPSLPFYLRRTVTLSTADARELTSNYLVHDPQLWLRAPGTTLRPRDWWREAALTCRQPSVFVIRSSDGRIRDELSERLALIIDTGKYAAFGPCGVTDLAGDRSRTPANSRGTDLPST